MYKRNYDTIGNLAPLDVFVFFEQFRDVNPSDIVLKASIENI